MERKLPDELPDGLLAELKAIVGRRYVLGHRARSSRFNAGYRVGGGDLAAVVRPGTLVELWRAAKACTARGTILIVQAANTSLTGGSTPFGQYDRPVVLISTTRIEGVTPISGGHEAICLAGSTLTQLEKAIRPLDRMPHSVIGSSCIGASVVGGICNNSGGALVRRGPAYTAQSLYARINAQGGLELVNRLGRDLGNSPEEILSALDAGETGQHTSSAERGDPPPDYAEHLREPAATPARYNADAQRLQEASGCAGKLIVFAVRVPTFPAPKRERSFIVGSNSRDHLAVLRRAMLDGLHPLPSVCEYMHRSASNLAASHGRDICMTLSLFGPSAMPRLLEVQKRVDAAGRRIGLGEHLAGRISQKLSQAGGHPLPRPIRRFVDAFEHVLLVTADDDGIERLRDLLETACRNPGMEFLAMTDNEASAAFRLRFASAGATVRLRDMAGNSELAALDVALPRNALDWFLDLPPELERQVLDRAIYGHFLCYVFHLDYVLKPGFPREDFERGMKELVEARGGRMPAEHNFGHLYKAPDHVAQFYRELDPTNSLNPGIGRTSRKKAWAQ